MVATVFQEIARGCKLLAMVSQVPIGVGYMVDTVFQLVASWMLWRSRWLLWLHGRFLDGYYGIQSKFLWQLARCPRLVMGYNEAVAVELQLV